MQKKVYIILLFIILLVNIRYEGQPQQYVQTTYSDTIVVERSEINDMVSYGNYMFIADYGAGIRIYDLTDPSIFDGLGVILLEGHIFAMEVSGSYLYVANYELGLLIYDISNIGLGIPSIVAELNVENIRGMELDNDLIIISKNTGVSFVNVTNPESPFVISTITTSYPAYDTAIFHGPIDVLYIVSNGYLDVYNINDLLNPSFLSTQYVGNSFDAQIDGSYLFIKTDYYLYSYDISGGAYINPTQSDSYLSGFPTYIGESFYINGTNLYLASGSNGLDIINITDPSSFVFISNLLKVYPVRNVIGVGNYAWIGNGIWGYSIVDLSFIISPSYVFGYTLITDDVQDVYVTDSHIFSVSSYDGLRIHDVNDYAYAKSTEFTNGRPSKILIEGDIAYISELPYDIRFLTSTGMRPSGGLTTVDVSDPANPNFMGFYNMSDDGIYSFDIENDYVYSVGTYNFSIFDVSNPISIVKSFSNSTPYNDIIVENSISYMASPQSLDVFNVSNPSSPIKVGTDDYSGIVKITKYGDFLFGRTISGDIIIYDVQDPYSPHAVGAFDTFFGQVVAITHYDNYLFALENEYPKGSAVEIYDISNPYNPVLEGTYFMRNPSFLEYPVADPVSSFVYTPRSIFATNTSIYIANGRNGIEIVSWLNLSITTENPIGSTSNSGTESSNSSIIPPNSINNDINSNQNRGFLGFSASIFLTPAILVFIRKKWNNYKLRS